ncbi:MAG: heavy metal translocating P-type ATPase metal-binding domain-containing protein [Planctomycetes bacterium]|nr:heavy metal translocating P-type ATPase metal-binding domain-containing protein [Planctomycetota bacterium]
MPASGLTPAERATAETRDADGPDRRAKEHSTCAHCGLPLPAGRPFGAFCCNGCRAVHRILHDEGLGRFYELGGADGQPIGAVPDGAAVARASHDWIAELEEQGRVGDGLVRCAVDVQGIHCAACVWLLQELWRRTPGGLRFDLNPALGRAEVVYDPRQASLEHFAGDIGRLGYRLGPPDRTDERGERGLVIRLGVCVALALNAMMFAFAGYFGLETGALHELFEWLAFGFATVVVLVGGPVFFRAALYGLRRRVLHLDLPISLGIALAYGASAFGFLTGTAAPYFDTVTIFVALMLIGRHAQRSAVRRNRAYLLAHDGGEHIRARRVRDGVVDRVPVRDLQVGDELLLAPGDLVPADVILLGSAAPFSLDWIHGESRPREFQPGERVPAGAFLGARRSARATVVRDAAASGLLRLLATPAPRDDDLRGRARFWSLVNRVYVLLVLAIAGVAGVAWALVDPVRAVSVTTAILVVTCPCALGLATPLAFDLTVAGLRRIGVFVRNPDLLEKVRHVRKIVFDKTGTLTWGGVEVRPLRDVPDGEVDALYTLAASSNHPVSAAVAASLRERSPRLIDGLSTVERIGAGVEAEHGGSVLRLGSQGFALGDRGEGGAGAGVCVFTRDGRPEAVFEVVEDYRSGADLEIRALAAQGYELHLLSGDRPDRVTKAAAELGFAPGQAQGGLEPDQKAEIVRRLDAADTLMVGDGLNDAPAFEAAFCAGTPALDRPVMPARADFFYTGVGTGAVSRVLSAGHRFHRVVAANLWLAGLYNALAIGLAAAGRMTPILCAVLMPLSSLVLVGYTALVLRDRSLQEQRDELGTGAPREAPA